MYQVLEVSLADTARLFRFNLEGGFGAGFSLKSFGNSWTVASRQWKAGERVLDVGAGYSDLPVYISKEFRCEIWAADDFGGDREDGFWLRRRKPDDHISKHPDIRFILERLGKPESSSLPAESFDCIYSVSALEHVPGDLFKSVVKHMDILLKPGGEMLHSIDIALPTNLGLRHVILAMAFDSVYRILPANIRERFLFETPMGCARFMLNILRTRGKVNLAKLNALNFVLDPEILLEPPENTFNRIAKDGIRDAKHFRVASLLIHLKKSNSEKS